MPQSSVTRTFSNLVITDLLLLLSFQKKKQTKKTGAGGVVAGFRAEGIAAGVVLQRPMLPCKESKLFDT